MRICAAFLLALAALALSGCRAPKPQEFYYYGHFDYRRASDDAIRAQLKLESVSVKSSLAYCTQHLHGTAWLYDSSIGWGSEPCYEFLRVHAFDF